MVAFASVLASNATIRTRLPANLVAVFAGATSGIGEATLKKFVSNTVTPRIYLVARNRNSAARVLADCRALNPDGQYFSIQGDLSLMSVVDTVCDEIKSKEDAVNLLFQSQGDVDVTGQETPEGLPLMMAVVHYSRCRFVLNLLPQLSRAAPSFARVVSISGGTKEGKVDLDDLGTRKAFQGGILGLSPALLKLRGHLVSQGTLTLEGFSARAAPGVGFVNMFPGLVRTPNQDKIAGVMGVLMRAFFWIFARWFCVPLQECAERCLFSATGERYDASGNGGARLTSGGVFSIDWDGEGTPERVEKLLDGYRKQGVGELVWEHMEAEFKRIEAM